MVLNFSSRNIVGVEIVGTMRAQDFQHSFFLMWGTHIHPEKHSAARELFLPGVFPNRMAPVVRTAPPMACANCPVSFPFESCTPSSTMAIVFHGGKRIGSVAKHSRYGSRSWSMETASDDDKMSG